MRKLISMILILLPTQISAGTISLSGTGGTIVNSISTSGGVSHDTGYVEFTSAANEASGSFSWTNPSNALTSLATFASVSNADDLTYYLNLTNASTALSGLASATSIDGIEVEVSATGDDGGPDFVTTDTIQLIIGGSRSGTNKADAGYQWGDSSIETVVYGGASDLWGLTPTKEQLMATNFGVSIRMFSDGTTANIEIYRIRVKVHYTASVGGIETR